MHAAVAMLNRALPDNFDSDIGTAFAAFRELTFRKEALMLTTSRNWYVVVLTGGLLLSGCNRGGNESQKTLGEKLDSATENAEQTADRVGAKAKAGAEVARDKLEATADKLEHKMEHAADRMEARSDQAGNALDDAGITGKVKTALIAATSLAAFKIDVDTHNHVVTLTGQVDTAASAAQAITIARSVDGVAKVESNLVVAARN